MSEVKQKRPKPEKVYMVRDDLGQIWKETVSTDIRQTKMNFAKQWLERINPDMHESQSLWYWFEKRGWYIEELEIKQD